MARNEISNSDDVIDSRDVIDRIEELDSERQALVDALNEWREATEQSPDDVGYRQDMLDASKALADWMAENALELEALRSFAEEAAGYAPDWEYGATLVRDSYFTTYTQEMLEDCGDLPKGLPHYIAIDWEATARNIRMDYTAVDFDGVTYWVR